MNLLFRESPKLPRPAGSLPGAEASGLTEAALREERLPFSVRVVRGEGDLRKAVAIRHAAYARHVPDLAERLPLGEGVEPLYLDQLDLSAFESSAPSVGLHALNLALVVVKLSALVLFVWFALPHFTAVKDDLVQMFAANGAGLAAGTVNAIAGGGSLITNETMGASRMTLPPIAPAGSMAEISSTP